MNAIISGKVEKQVGSIVWETFQTQEFRSYSPSYYVYNVSISDWIRLIDNGGAISAILPVSSIWRESSTEKATRLYPVQNNLQYYIFLNWVDNTLRIGDSFAKGVDTVYDKVEIGTLKY